MAILDRLAGLETEYAIRFHPDGGDRAAPSHFEFYNKLIDELRRDLPAVRASHAKLGYFFATGGSVWYEKTAYRPFAVIEGATPECRGPRNVLTWQRAQDAMLAEAARATDAAGEFTLCKSDADAWGNVYSGQENYEATLATGARWWAWRVGCVMLIPLVAIGWIAALHAAMLVVVYYVIAVPLWLAAWTMSRAFGADGHARRARALKACMIGDARGLVSDQHNVALPPVLAPVLRIAEHLAATPVALAMLALANATAFRDTRRKLLPFLVSRAVFTGAGRLDDRGRFHVAAKACGINYVTGFGGFFGDHPIFSFGHLLKDVFILWTMPRARGSVRNRKQRLQISIGDSNLCEEAEYLRIATTMLVIDAIEAGEFDDVPALRRPIRALRAITSDPALTTRVKFSDGSTKTALEIQRAYLRGCQRMLSRHPHAPAEAHDVVRRWEEVLDLLETDPDQLIGRVDWITKRYLLRQCGADAPPAAQKKIDLRYHELSPDGYFQRLTQATVPKRVLTDAEIDRACRVPPPDSPATVRGKYVRDLAERPDARANWQTVTLGHPTPNWTFDLTRCPRGEETQAR